MNRVWITPSARGEDSYAALSAFTTIPNMLGVRKEIFDSYVWWARIPWIHLLQTMEDREVGVHSDSPHHGLRRPPYIESYLPPISCQHLQPRIHLRGRVRVKVKTHIVRLCEWKDRINKRIQLVGVAIQSGENLASPFMNTITTTSPPICSFRTF